MARRTSNKIEPAVMTFVLNTANVLPGATSEFTADLSQIASTVNRRFYRQGLNWAVAGFKIITSGDDLVINVKKLPNTWVLSNAWEKGMRAWLKLSREAFQEAQSTPGRFLDFKIYADKTHHAAGYAANLVPIDGQLPVAVPYRLGEWIPSEIVTAQPSGTPVNQTEYEIVAVGGNYPGLGASGRDAVSLIEGYANSRALPYAEDPNVPNYATDVAGVTPENWLSSMFDDGTQQTDIVITNEIQYDQPPYPFEGDGTNTDTQYPGGELNAPALEVHDAARVTSTTLSNTTRIKGGNFPCGLVRFDLANVGDNASNMTILIDLVPGNHRGYLCEPMTEM